MVRGWLVGKDGVVVGEAALSEELPEVWELKTEAADGTVTVTAAFRFLERHADGSAVYVEVEETGHRHSFEVVVDGTGEPVGLVCAEAGCPAVSGWRVEVVA